MIKFDFCVYADCIWAWRKKCYLFSPLKGLSLRAILCIMASFTSLLRTHWIPRFWNLEKTKKQSVKLCRLVLSGQMCLVLCIVHLEHWSQRLKLTGRVRLELTILTYCLTLRADWSSKALILHIRGIPYMAPYSETTCFFKKNKKKKNGQPFARELW